MRIKDYTDTIRHLTDSFNIPEARRMIAENPALTQEQFKAGGIVEPGVTHYAILTEAEKRANVKTWEKNTGLNFEDVENKKKYKIRSGVLTGAPTGGIEIPLTGKDLKVAQKVYGIETNEELKKIFPDKAQLRSIKANIRKGQTTMATVLGGERSKNPGTIKFEKWIDANPDVDFSKYTSVELAKKAKANVSISVANNVLREKNIAVKYVAQAKEKQKIFDSSEFKNWLKNEKDTKFSDFLKHTAEKKDKNFLIPFKKYQSHRAQLPGGGKGYISQVELTKMLEPHGLNYPNISGGRTVDSYLFDKINTLLDGKQTKSTEAGKFGKQKAAVTGERSFYFYKKPTSSQIKEIVEFREFPVLRPNTVEAMELFDKKFKTGFENKVFPSLEKARSVLKEAKLPNSPAQAARALSQLARTYRGQKFQNDIRIGDNKVMGNYITRIFGEYGLMHPWRRGVYAAALDDIKLNVGKEAGDLKKFKGAFDRHLRKNYPGSRSFALNEVFSVTASASNKSYPYAYFVDVMDSTLNTKDLAAFQGQLSLAEARVSKAINDYRKTGNVSHYKKAQDIKDVFNNRTRKRFSNTISKNYPGEKANLTRIEIGKSNQILKNKDFAADYYAKSKLNKWKNLGLDIGTHSAEAGYIKTGAEKKGTVAIQELFTPESRLEKKIVVNQPAMSKFLGEKTKPSALRELMQRTGSGIDPILAGRAVVEETGSLLKGAATKFPKTTAVLKSIFETRSTPGALFWALEAPLLMLQGTYNRYANERDFKAGLKRAGVPDDAIGQLGEVYGQELADVGQVGLESWAVDQPDTFETRKMMTEQMAEKKPHFETRQAGPEMLKSFGQITKSEREMQDYEEQLKQQEIEKRTREAYEKYQGRRGRREGGIMGLKK